MSHVEPVVATRTISRRGDIPGCPPGPDPFLREVARLQWWVGAGGDPAALVEEFLTGHGFAVTDLAAAWPAGPWSGAPAWEPGQPGAALLISAAAAARMAGSALATPVEPAPAVPDLVVVVYAPARHPPPRPDSGPAPWSVGQWQPSWTGAEHAEAVRRVRSAIAAGDVYQVNAVGHARAGYRGDPGPALRRVSRLPGARYGGLLTGDGWAVACASPETLVAVTGGRAVTRPIKGTRPATADGRVQLLGSTKERAEHVMIVDLARNDLARVAATGSVRVDQLYAVRRWCGLWQAESTVSARLAPGIGLASLLRALCPGGSVTGAPKLSALDVVSRVEPAGRGPSMGALGWIGPAGIDLGLTIRTVAADGQWLHVWAGGGITWGSEPAAEVAEAAAKAAPVRAALAGPAAADAGGPGVRPDRRSRSAVPG